MTLASPPLAAGYCLLTPRSNFHFHISKVCSYLPERHLLLVLCGAVPTVSDNRVGLLLSLRHFSHTLPQRAGSHRDNMASRVAKSHFSKLEYHYDTPYSDREMLWLF